MVNLFRGTMDIYSGNWQDLDVLWSLPSLSILQDSHTGDNVVFQTAVCQAEVNCFSLTPPQFVSPTLSIVLITRLNRHLQIQVLKKIHYSKSKIFDSPSWKYNWLCQPGEYIRSYSACCLTQSTFWHTLSFPRGTCKNHRGLKWTRSPSWQIKCRVNQTSASHCTRYSVLKYSFKLLTYSYTLCVKNCISGKHV